MRLRLCLKNTHLPFYAPLLLLRSLSASPKSVNCEYRGLKFRRPSKGPAKDTCMCTRNLDGSGRQGKSKNFSPNFRQEKMLTCFLCLPHVFSPCKTVRERRASQMKPLVRRHSKLLNYLISYPQILIATSTLAWGVNFPAHLVVVKGTEYYDGKTRRYVDFPITDVLQMMGRAGRPQYDDHGVAVILVHDIKKHFYKKFLYEPFPVESRFVMQ